MNAKTVSAGPCSQLKTRLGKKRAHKPVAMHTRLENRVHSGSDALSIVIHLPVRGSHLI